MYWANEDNECVNYQLQHNNSGTKNSMDSLHGDVITVGSFSDEVTLMQPSQPNLTWAYSSVNKSMCVGHATSKEDALTKDFD